ncbi:MAG TPA: tetratricopeptide repeat protein, partial [Puia sp.]|nr:tetratricopeptide repeat protein [Puia sp.]
MHYRLYLYLYLSGMCIAIQRVDAQSSLSAGDIFQQARSLAFDGHDYPAAIQRTREALALSPRDPDIRIFLGRLYTWIHQPDSARQAFDEVLRTHPGYEDGYVAY